MTFLTCIDNAEKENVIDAPRAKAARARYEQNLRRFRQDHSDMEAHRLAAKETFAELNVEAAEKKRRVYLQAAAGEAIRLRIETYKGPGGPGRAGIAFFDRLDPYRDGHAFEARKAAWARRAFSRMDEVLMAFRRGTFTQRRNVDLARDVVRELFGKDTANANARELAAAWTAGAEELRQAFNAAGGHIAKRENWGLPQAHDGVKVRAATFEEWRGFLVDGKLLDRDAMVDGITGKRLSDVDLETALKDIYDAIRTEGWSRRDPAAITAGSARANRRADHRFMIFRDADAWLAYQERFGAGTDPHAIMMNHIEGMSTDIALMELFGPNPRTGVAYLQNLITQKMAKAGQAEKARGPVKEIDDLYAHATNAANIPVRTSVANFFSAARSLLVASQLGSAVVAAVFGDFNFGRMTRAFNGMPQGRQLGQFLRQLNPRDPDDRAAAIRFMIGADNYVQSFSAMQRFTDDVVGPEWARRTAAAVLNVSGLSAVTQAGRQAFGMEFLRFLAENAGKKYGALTPALRDALGRYGIGADDWDVIRATPMAQHRGHDVLDPRALFDRGLRETQTPGIAAGRRNPKDDLFSTPTEGVEVGGDPLALPRARAEDLGFKLLDLVQTETEFAVPSASMRARALLTESSQPGTIQGEVVRSALMYKGFSLTLYFAHGRRAMARARPADRAKYLASLVVLSGVAGALAIQTKELLKGRDPLPMLGPGFMAKAIVAGGGLGILGDFVSVGVTGRTPFGASLAEVIAGPVVGLGADVGGLAFGIPADAVEGELDATIGRQVTGFLRRYTPGANLWFLRTGLDRYVFDVMQEAVDPDFHDMVRRRRNTYRRDFGTDYFFAPGNQPGFDGSAIRAPDLANAFRSAP